MDFILSLINSFFLSFYLKKKTTYNDVKKFNYFILMRISIYIDKNFDDLANIKICLSRKIETYSREFSRNLPKT